MHDSTAAAHGAPAPRPTLDAARLDAFLRGRIEGWRGPVEVQAFAGGQSNPTYLLRTPTRRYVLRRKPPGVLLASAHAVDREFRVLRALAADGRVPVPRPHAYCDDPDVIGSPFYVMDCIDGRTFWDASFPEVPRAERPRYCDALNATLATLHGLDHVALGLADFGRPGDYFQRQISRWSRQYLDDDAAGRVPAMERLIEWLPLHVPPGEDAAIVHGDFRCDNVLFHPTEPRVVAVLDWELSTIGHPLADFGYHLLMYRMPTLGVTGLLDRDLAALNVPAEAEYVAAYCRRTGRDGIAQLDFYFAFNFFRLAAIFHGIRGRVVRGTAVSARAAEYAALVERIAELGCAQIAAR